MDFKSLLQSFNTLSEAETKDTKTGKVHKGDYGNKHGKEDVRDQYGSRIGKVDKESEAKKDAPKKGRGRPKKGADDSGEVKSYDTKSLGSVFGGGQKPKSQVGTVSKKHSLKEYMESVEDTKHAESVMEGMFGDTVDHSSVAANLSKLARVIKSVQTPEQFAVARKYARRMSGTIMKHQHDNSGFGSGLKANLAVMRDIHADLQAKANELGIDFDPLAEDGEQIQIKPASQTNTQVIQQGDKTLGTVTNPQLAAQIKQSIGKGEMTLTGDDEQMNEGKDQGKPGKNFAKIAKSAAQRYGSKEAGARVAGAVRAKLAKAGKLEELSPATIQSAAAKRDAQSPNQMSQATQRKDIMTHLSNRIKMNNRPGNEEGAVEESGLQAYLGNKKYGKDGMDALRKAGQDHASEKKMQNIRAKFSNKEEVSEGKVQGKLKESAEEKSYTCVHAKKGKCEVTAPTSYDAAKKAAAKWKLKSTSGIDAHLNTTKVAVDEAAKPDFLDMDKDGNKKESFKKAVNDKKSKKKVAESRIYEDSEYTYETVAKVLAREKPGLNTSSDDFASAVYHELVAIGMTPKSAHNMLSYNEDFLSDVASSYEHYQTNPSLDEAATEDFAQKAPGIKPSKMVQVPDKQESTPWSVDPINAATDRAYNFISSLKKPSLFKEGTDMKDIQMESWESQLNSLLKEGITVSTSTGQQGAPDSVSINATDADAEQLLSVLRSSGMGVFGGNEKPEVGYGVAQGGEEEADGTGTEPEMSPEVVGDGDDMLALIKKMSGIGGEHPQAQDSEDGEDYQDEESSEAGTLEPASADDEESGDEEQESSEESDDEEEEQTDEGNAFTGKLKDTPKGGEFKLGNKEYKDTSSIEEEHDHDHEEGETCNECGMMECECEPGEEEQVTEWANDAGGDASADTELMKLKALLSIGNDLHKMKSSQAMGNPVRVVEAKQMINEWKKLSGI